MGIRSSRSISPNIPVLPNDSPPVKILDSWPDVTFYEAYNFPEEPAEAAINLKGRAVKSKELFANKRIVLLGLPGAFTPNCHRTHIPQYLAASQQFIDLGVDQIIAYAVNDTFCMRYVAEKLFGESCLFTLRFVSMDPVVRALWA